MPPVDFLVKGTPIRPARPTFTKLRGYHIHSSNDDSSKITIAQRFKGRMQVSSDHGPDGQSIPEADRSMEMHDIPVETQVDIAQAQKTLQNISE